MVKMMSKTVHGNVFQINVKPETVGQRGLPKYPTQRALVTRVRLEMATLIGGGMRRLMMI